MSKIFVSIACFCDKDIKNTIEDCLLKAKNPDDIIFGICLQYDPEDDFLKDYDNKPQFRIKKIHWKEAKGPTYARYLISKLLENEEYFLQIDAHTRFFQNWDLIATECLKDCNDDKAILTTFPVGIANMNRKNMFTNKSCKKFKSLSYESIKLTQQSVNINKPELTYYLSAAFLFGKSEFVNDVKFDPYLTYSYQTIEQQFYAVRLFTYGWNLYTPHKHILGTSYTKEKHYDSKNNIIHAPSNHRRGRMSWNRVLYYYGLKNLNEIEEVVKENIEEYGIGNIRSLNDFFKINNQDGCIDKLKNGMIYKDGSWAKYRYSCSNIILNRIIKNNTDFEKSDGTNLDLSWDMQIKTIKHKLQFYPASNVSFIDNKKTLFRHLLENDCINGLPKTYLDINEIKEDNKNYFFKFAGSNGGKSVFIYNKISDIRSHIIEDKRPYIIQEEVPNMLLISNKKFVLRNWIVIINDKFYLSLNGKCLIHQLEYNKNELNRQAHIEHDSGKIKYMSYQELAFYNESMPKVVKVLTDISNIIKKRLSFNNNCYQILGVDIIFDNDLNPFVLEINSWPNMSTLSGASGYIMEEFFTNFFNDIILPKISNKPIIANKYFCELDTNKPLNLLNIPKMLSKDSIQTILINNKSSIEIIDSLNKNDINFSLFDIIKVDEIKFNELLNSKKISLDRYKLSNCQVSLWLTHLHIWQKMIEDNVDKLLIIESSCKFVSNFTEMYNTVLTKSKFLEYDILYLGYCGVSATNDELSLTNTGCPRLTSSYIITLNGAKKLVEKLSSIDYPFDELLGSLFFKKEINGYRATQLLTYQDFQLNKPDLYHII